ncbi:alpha/beta fold hydrolase [Pseudooceanicola atlanticus]|uniref:Alpha/beta hydrolase n=1 Tax=Pseudooceanicola atlanticus TaxID=1461694 RepID=A0A0A0ECX9_9RHOB|nr:alpha/beta hydrolase [Pseudooceanicola atlanticus]KGM48269.1 alpha/beta hydrolase [Pseudooceanicola atlanticus]
MPNPTTVVLIGLLVLVGLVILGLIAFVWNFKRRAERLAPPRGAFTRISTGRLHYLDCGSGPAIVLIHTLDGNLGHFDLGVIDELAKNFRVIAVDRPGSGYSDRPTHAGANIRTQGRQMIELIEKLEIDNPLIVGHGIGGSIALALAVERPDLICGLALLSPVSLPIDPDDEVDAFSDYQIGTNASRWIQAWTTAVPHRIRHPGNIEDRVFGPDIMPPEFLIKGGAILSLRPNAFFNASRDYMALFEDLPGLSRDYKRLAVPVRILFGSEDRLLNPDHHGTTLVTRYPQMALKMVEGGHMLPLTHPEDCVAFIRDSAAALKDRRFISRASPEVYR